MPITLFGGVQWQSWHRAHAVKEPIGRESPISNHRARVGFFGGGRLGLTGDTQKNSQYMRTPTINSSVVCQQLCT